MILSMFTNTSIGIDLEQAAVSALGILNDTELGILDEYMSLVHSGFSASEIESMMGLDSYQAALSAVEKSDMEYNRITAPTVSRHQNVLEPELDAPKKKRGRPRKDKSSGSDSCRT